MSLSSVDLMGMYLPQYIGDPSVPLYLQDADDNTAPVSSVGWDAVTRARAVALRAAHNMSLDRDPSRAGGAAGAITGKREGDLSVSFSRSAPPGGEDDLDQTHFGLRLKRLIRTSFVGGFVAGGDGPLGLESLPFSGIQGGPIGW